MKGEPVWSAEMRATKWRFEDHPTNIMTKLIDHDDEFDYSKACLRHLQFGKHGLMNFRKAIGTAVLIVLSIGFSWTFSANAQTKAAKIDTLMGSLSERGQFSGSILVAEHGQIIYEHWFGKADIKRNLDFAP